MWCKKRHRFVVAIVRPIMMAYLRLKYNLSISYKNNPYQPEGSFVVVSNHVTSLDPFIMGGNFKRHIYYMASIDIFEHAFIGKLIKFLVNPIPKEKSKKSDLKSIKACLKVIKENQPIGIFVEGNRTLSGELCHVNPSIAKLVKSLKRPLVIMNIIGGYGTDPRWGKSIRKGKMESKVVKVLQYEDYKDLSDEELFKIIIDNINVNNYDFNTNFKSNKKAEYLERVTYICPVCKSKHTLHSKGDFLTCSNCNLKVKYNENLLLTSENKEFKFKTVADWYNYQIDYVKNEEFDDNIIYQDDILLSMPRLFKSRKKIGKGKFIAYKDRFEVELKNNKKVFEFDNIEAVTLLGKKKMNIYYNNETYQVFGDKKLNLLKYMHLHYIIKNKGKEDDYEFLGL